ncbi:MFS transporter [Streptomyces sp. TLI_171]|uniref:MFS transporter n=1 Tax=Streptomyces sp. TLI_171 TaxID=1938859 RepID=UPI000C17D782|nr:MFS transporter [Streptomyces sp. TLI_171]RKE20789.1 sugar phosphate permease [Streptomyces sp. TLI_171]
MSNTVPAPGGRRLRKGLALTAVCLAGGILPASLTGSSVALPGIGHDLDAGLAPLQWVVNSYNLTFGSFMLAAGSLADRVGRRRMFTAGTVLFALSSLLSALAGNVYLLDALRALAGLGAAAVLTSGSALLAGLFEGPALGRAFGILGSSFGAGLALGPSTAGLLVSAFGWRAVFLSHLAVAALALVLVPVVPADRPERSGGRADWIGTLTFTGALFLFTLAMVEGPQLGWFGGGQVPGLVAGSLALLVAFVVAERRLKHPMFDLTLFRNPRFVAVCLMPVVLAFGFVSLLVLLPSWLVAADGLSTAAAGAAMMALTAPVLLLPALAGKLSARVPAGALLGASLVLMAAGTAWLTVVRPGISTAALVGPLLVIGAGMGIAAGLLDAAAIGSVEPERAGMAAGMFNTMRLAGETVAIVIMSAILVSLTAGRLTGAPAAGGALAGKLVGGDLSGALALAPGADPAAFTAQLADGYTGALRLTLWILTAICLLSTVPVVLLVRDRRTAPAATAPDAPDAPAGELSTAALDAGFEAAQAAPVGAK